MNSLNVTMDSVSKRVITVMAQNKMVMLPMAQIVRMGRMKFLMNAVKKDFINLNFV